MINEGLFLMFVGMTVVFSFLILLVIVMSLSAKFFESFAEYFPEPVEKKRTLSSTDHTETAAVLAAVYHYQNRL